MLVGKEEPHLSKAFMRLKTIKEGEKMKKKMAKNMLSSEFKVACEISRHDDSNEHIWFTELVEKLSGKVSPNTIRGALDALFDWDIVRAEYGETEKGRAGRLYHITGESKSIIRAIRKEFYDKTD